MYMSTTRTTTISQRKHVNIYMQLKYYAPHFTTDRIIFPAHIPMFHNSVSRPFLQYPNVILNMYAFKHNTTFHTVTDAPRLACIELKLTNQSPVYLQVWLHAAKTTLLPLFILLFF